MTAQAVASYYKALATFQDEYTYNHLDRNYSVAIHTKQGCIDNFLTIRCLNGQNSQVHKDVESIYNSKVHCKFHLSIREENLSHGWNSLISTFLDHELNLFKVVRPGKKLSRLCNPKLNLGKQNDQCGKDITIYINANLEKSFDDWARLLNNCIEQLISNEIPAGYQVTSFGNRADILFSGFPHYVSYRYENKNSLETDYLEKITITLSKKHAEMFYTKPEMQSLTTRPWAGMSESPSNNIANQCSMEVGVVKRIERVQSNKDNGATPLLKASKPAVSIPKLILFQSNIIKQAAIEAVETFVEASHDSSDSSNEQCTSESPRISSDTPPKGK